MHLLIFIYTAQEEFSFVYDKSELYSMTAACQFHLFSFIPFFTYDDLIFVLYMYGHGNQSPGFHKHHTVQTQYS